MSLILQAFFLVTVCLSITVSGEKIKYALAIGKRNRDLGVYNLWTRNVNSEAPKAECGLECYSDSKCVSYTLIYDEGLCKGHSQTSLGEIVSGSKFNVMFFFSEHCGNPTNFYKAKIRTSNKKDRYNKGEILKLKCLDNHKKFDSQCGDYGQWTTDISICQETPVTTTSLTTSEPSTTQATTRATSTATSAIVTGHTPSSTITGQTSTPTTTSQTNITQNTGTTSAATVLAESTALASVSTTKFVPQFWSTVELNRQLIFLVESLPGPYSYALSTCHFYGGQLIRVVDSDVMEFVKLIALANKECLYINGKAEGGIWKYDDGEEMNTFFWAENQPSLSQDNNVCITVPDYSGMHDASCNAQCKAFCEYV